jgi:hypothetical protein
MHRIVWWLIMIIGTGLIGLIAWNALQKSEPVVVPPAPRVMPPPPAPPAEPEIRHPVPEKLPEKPLPALETSDSTMKNALTELSGGSGLVEVLMLQGFIRRVVATVDNLPAPKVAIRILPVKPVGGAFAVSGKEENYAIAAENAARYAKYVKLAEAIDSQKLAAFYVHYYPLFQQAYRELGYPKGHFNDRLVAVIDHLLEAPELKTPVALVRPKVFYLYANPELEKRSAGQKILMRMGAENARKIKAKLREIRAEIARPAAAAGKGR